jgi:flagellar motor switch protein FliG
MADILNEMDSETCDLMLAQMEGQIDDKKLALVKSMMFRFEDVVRMATEDRTKLCDGLPQELLTNALYKADKSVMEAVLSSLGQRTRRMIESEISDDVKIQENTVLQARKSIATLALKMAAEGQITLPEK